jgi:hypothetical protein
MTSADAIQIRRESAAAGRAEEGAEMRDCRRKEDDCERGKKDGMWKVENATMESKELTYKRA